MSTLGRYRLPRVTVLVLPSFGTKLAQASGDVASSKALIGSQVFLLGDR